MHSRASKLLEDIRSAHRRLSPDHRFRNVLIHGYDIIDPAIVWSAIADDLVPLLRDVEALLADSA
jgi:uncharacterized protein with HEPN domain